MYGSMGGMYGSGGLSDGYGISSKRPRMTESNPYFAVSSGSSGGHNPPATFPVVRLRGLPFNCTDAEIFNFFTGLEIVDLLLVNKSGKFSGEAFVVFSRPVQADIAVQKNHQHIGRRYVEVFKCKKQEYYNTVAAEVGYDSGYYDKGYRRSPSRSRSKKEKGKDQTEYTEILKLRGLPFNVTKDEIVEFFKDYKVVEEKVHIACRPDGKVSGEAYVTFETAEVAKQAMCKDRLMIGSRYVELFPSTPDEARRAESRSRQ
ncbi:putative RNA recognition motif domain, nucleotide-binding alpha-beta plait domain superfamily [Helianthus annuus]|uniref:Putative nucleotide-binding alpha-beta plait domain-containing protein n=1 Tax=Helianthus annuus TaxID=4232 RepID=A0A251TVR5_HELAN|nr:heterogeneous nuclear ribonucleoprotein H [Helianthus annuus]KAF5798510.1 putative RNA recognition motif domain, nucleotide-binding alpha-beta plait domain superfamily [Helianthus annuus]KAJ0550095.1 putative RNA recognition motif domain, nucleotide-binding alpha-beta plait domain superfamily [Helianthus annuus]KAJ0556704.1 putative RNA recognition motif domain, nucleotide-binding alpha-beta plait domain superfamily [Helianthus annuus]KAJ0563049.1 putative RNA recognition motif domain, nucle